MVFSNPSANLKKYSVSTVQYLVTSVIRSKHTSNTLLCLLQFFMRQTLLWFNNFVLFLDCLYSIHYITAIAKKFARVSHVKNFLHARE